MNRKPNFYKKEEIVMGKFDSSVYRVRPLMEQIEKDQNPFAALLSLVEIAPLGAPRLCRYDGANCKEKQLKPTKKHLLPQIVFADKADITQHDR